MMAWSICYFNGTTRIDRMEQQCFSILLQLGITYYKITFLNEIFYCCSILGCPCNFPIYFLPLNIIVILTRHALLMKGGPGCKRIKLFSYKNENVLLNQENTPRVTRVTGSHLNVPGVSFLSTADEYCYSRQDASLFLNVCSFPLCVTGIWKILCELN